MNLHDIGMWIKVQVFPNPIFNPTTVKYLSIDTKSIYLDADTLGRSPKISVSLINDGKNIGDFVYIFKKKLFDYEPIDLHIGCGFLNNKNLWANTDSDKFYTEKTYTSKYFEEIIKGTYNE